MTKAITVDPVVWDVRLGRYVRDPAETIMPITGTVHIENPGGEGSGSSSVTTIFLHSLA